RRAWGFLRYNSTSRERSTTIAILRPSSVSTWPKRLEGRQVIYHGLLARQKGCGTNSSRNRGYNITASNGDRSKLSGGRARSTSGTSTGA
ncbi:unnamed protein product, partial [Ectocarpus sp. 12 AP-2014]